MGIHNIMSSYKQTINQKRNTKQAAQIIDNDMSNLEFDDYYQECLANKNRKQRKAMHVSQNTESQTQGNRLEQKILIKFSDVVEKFEEVPEKESDKGFFDEEVNLEWDNYYQNRYENYTDEEIDRAFEEAERWADF